MDDVFIVNPTAKHNDIEEAIFVRVEMSAAVSRLVAQAIDEGGFSQLDKAVTNALWVVEHFISEVRLLLLYSSTR